MRKVHMVIGGKTACGMELDKIDGFVPALFAMVTPLRCCERCSDRYQRSKRSALAKALGQPLSVQRAREEEEK